MMLTTWTPRAGETSLMPRGFREFDWMDRLLGDVVRAFDRSGEWVADTRAAYPHLDLAETNDEYVVRADLPGLAREDVEIDVTADRLTLRGRHQAEFEGSNECVVCRERDTGSFERTIPMPAEVRVDDVNASMKNGVLTVHLPKAFVASARRVEVTEH